MINFRACSVTWHAILTRLLMTVLCLICDFLPVASDIDILAVPGVCDVKGIVFCHPQPVLFAFLTEVVLNDEMASTLQEDADIFGRIISRIKPEKHGFIRQPAAEVDGLLQELGRALLAVLFPFAQFQVGKVPFAADIGKHGRIAVTAIVGPGHAFLAGLRIVKRGDIHVCRNIPARPLRRDNAVGFQHLNVFIQDLSADGSTDHVKALVQDL